MYSLLTQGSDLSPCCCGRGGELGGWADVCRWNGCVLLQTESRPFQHSACGHQGEIPRVYLQAFSGTILDGIVNGVELNCLQLVKFRCMQFDHWGNSWKWINSFIFIYFQPGLTIGVDSEWKPSFGNTTQRFESFHQVQYTYLQN